MKVTTAKEARLSQDETPLSGLRWETLPRLAVLVGPAGIGKTRFLLEHFARLIHERENPFDRDLLYLLPTAEHRERIVDLILRKEGSGFFGDAVTTLSRLMQELLKGGDLSPATGAQRRFLLSEIVPEKAGEYFSSVIAFPGFLEKVSDFLGELKESMVSLEAFRQGVKKLKEARPETIAKYEGLLRIYEAYEARLRSLDIRDHRDGLFLLRKTVGADPVSARKGRPQGSPLRFRHLFVDGFFDFSRSQLEFLGWLAQHSERVTLSLTLDLSRERESLFSIPLTTLKELEKLGFQSVSLSGLVNHRTSSRSLHHIEQNLFGPPPRDGEPSDGSLLILEATGIRGEVEMMAREIRRLVRTQGLHFSDIAVILRRIGEYEGILRTVFREFQIPVEIHERERLRDAPLARTLASFFKVLLDDWKREDLFNFLKSSYVETDYAEVCALEIRGFDLGIVSGRRRWRGEAGHSLFEKIAVFQDRFLAATTVDAWIRLTQEVIHSFGLDRIPPVYEERARRDFAALKRLRVLLNQIRGTSRSRGGASQTFETFTLEFLGLIEVDLFSLHERDKNRVQVYDVSLARQKEYKVVFLAGLLEKYFPAEVREDPILSDGERRVMGLAERLPRQALERYFFYLGITRAREKVILSYPRFDLEGHEALPSFYVEEVGRLFSDPLPMRSYPVNQSLPRLEDAVEEREIEAHLVHRLYERAWTKDRRDRAFTLALYNRFLPRPSFQALLPRVLFDPAAVLESQEARASFLPKGGIFKPTGLEAYGRCPYRYFAREVLRLEEREEGIDPAQVGKVLHKVLEGYWRERVEKGRKELEELATAKAFLLERLRELLKKEPLQGDRAYRIELKKAQMEDWLVRMMEKEREEGNPLEPLQPRHFEFEFGFKPKEVDYLKLFDPLREDLKLRGKIDRIDVDPSGRYALVIDYKTGGSFQRKNLDFGTSLQLPLYLLAVQKLLKLKPVGAEIYQIKEAKRNGFYSREGLEGSGAETSSRSILDQKEFDRLVERAVRFSFKFAEGITHAEIPVRPRDCDPHCPFPSLCRIEKWRLPFIYQEIREEDQKNGIV